MQRRRDLSPLHFLVIARRSTNNLGKIKTFFSRMLKTARAFSAGLLIYEQCFLLPCHLFDVDKSLLNISRYFYCQFASCPLLLLLEMTHICHFRWNHPREHIAYLLFTRLPPTSPSVALTFRVIGGRKRKTCHSILLLAHSLQISRTVGAFHRDSVTVAHNNK